MTRPNDPPVDDSDPLDDWQAIRRRDRRKRVAIWLGGIVLIEAIAVAVAGVDGALGGTCIVVVLVGAGTMRALVDHGKAESREKADWDRYEN